MESFRPMYKDFRIQFICIYLHTDSWRFTLNVRTSTVYRTVFFFFFPDDWEEIFMKQSVITNELTSDFFVQCVHISWLTGCLALYGTFQLLIIHPHHKLHRIPFSKDFFLFSEKPFSLHNGPSTIVRGYWNVWIQCKDARFDNENDILRGTVMNASI